VSGINNKLKSANTEPHGVVPSLLPMNDSLHGSMTMSTYLSETNRKFACLDMMSEVREEAGRVS